MGLADLHNHTTWSWDGTAGVEAVVRYSAQQTPLDVIAITDLDEIRGALAAVALGKQYGIEVIPGCEITTAEGHLLGLFMHAPVPAGLSLVESILRVAEQGGLCILPHPLAVNARGVTETALRIALRDPDVRRVLVALESFNAGLIYRLTNQAAENLAIELQMPRTGSSDSHLLWMIGSGKTAFAGRSAADLRAALEAGAVLPVRHGIFPPLRLALDWTRQIFLRRLARSAR
jgi:predicted metal-dependent phosphoesterase TrpH